MTLDNNKARELFNVARNLPSAEREPFLDKECGEDDALRVEVEALPIHDFSINAPQMQVASATQKKMKAKPVSIYISIDKRCVRSLNHTHLN